MISTSQALIIALDLFFVAAAGYAIHTLLTRATAIRFAGMGQELGVIAAGLGVFGIFYFGDFLLRLFGPLTLSPAAQGDALHFWHDRVSWGFAAAVSVFVLFGFVRLVRRLESYLKTNRKATKSLELELDSRSTLEEELKTDARIQRASSRAKSEFLAGMSHEFRTPLNGILGLTGLLSNTELNDDQRKLLSTLEESSQVLLKRVNEVLDLSRIEIGQVDLQPTAFKPVDLVRSVTALFSPLATEKGLELTESATPSASREVVGDPQRIRQVLTNLVSNAIKYTPAGSVKIHTNVDRAGPGRLWLIFTVTDSGVGMEEDAVKRLSQPPVRLTSRRPGEPGLGLSIAWKLAELMDGDIAVSSKPDEGSVFTARLQVGLETDAGDTRPEDLV